GAAVLRPQRGLRDDGGLHDRAEETVSVRDGLRPGRLPQPRPRLGRGLFAGFLGAHPVLDVVGRQVGDRGFGDAAGGLDVAGDGEAVVDVAFVVAAGAFVDAGEPVDVAVRPVGEGHVAGYGGFCHEALAADPAGGPVLAVGVDQLLELFGGVLVGELLSFPGAAASALEPADLVDRGVVLAVAFSDARHGGQSRAAGREVLGPVWPGLWGVTCLCRWVAWWE